MRNIKNLVFILLVLSAATFSACKKSSQSIDQYVRFALQTHSFAHTNGDTITIIQFGTCYPQSTNNIQHLPVSIYTCVIGGINSFADQTSAQNYQYQIDTLALTANFTDNSMVFSNNESVGITSNDQTRSANQFTSVSSVTYHGISYDVYDRNMFFAMATYNTIALWYNALIKENKPCTFSAAVYGKPDSVRWIISNNIISANASTINIYGKIVNHTFGTPTVIDTISGNEYIICFYNLDGTNKTQCTCTEDFKVYLVGNAQAIAYHKLSANPTLVVSRN